MKFRVLTIVAGFLAAINIQAIQAQGMEFFQGTWEEAKATAKKENKSIFLDAYASWCGPCKNMAKFVFTEPSVGTYYNSEFVNVKMDMEKGEGIALSNAFKITAYPTYLYFNPNGELVHRALGQKSAQDFIYDGVNALDESTQLITMQNRYIDGDRDSNLLRNYALALQYSGAVPEMVEKISADYIGGLNKDELRSEEALSFLMKTTWDPKSYTAQLLLNNKDALVDHFGESNTQIKFKDLAIQGAARAAHQRDELALDDAKDFAKRALKEDYKNFDLQLDMIYNERTKNWKKYSSVATKYYSNPGFEPSWNELNTVAWNYYLHVDDKSDLQNALSWAKQSVKLDANSYNLDTYAALLFKTGSNKKAMKFAKKAIAAAKTEGLDPSATEKLVRQIKAEK